MDKDTDEDVPEERRVGDYVHLAVKAGLSAVPLVGGPAAEVMAFFFKPALEARRDKWLEALREDLDELGDKVNDLPRPEEFITIALQASQIAMRTHQEEKLKFLRNAVKNTAKEPDPTEDQALIFLNILDALTPSHVKALKAFENNPIPYKPKGPAPIDDDEEEDKEEGPVMIHPDYQYVYNQPANILGVLNMNQDKKGRSRSIRPLMMNDEDMYSQVARKIDVGNREFLRQILKDLLTRGLIEEQDGGMFMFGRSNETQSLAISHFGSRFLAFIGD